MANDTTAAEMAARDLDDMLNTMNGTALDYEDAPVNAEWMYVRDLPDADVLTTDDEADWQVAPGVTHYSGAELCCVWAEGEGLLILVGDVIIYGPGHEMERRYRLLPGGRLVELQTFANPSEDAS